MKPGKGRAARRAAGAGVQLIAREGVYATLRLRSGEMRRVPGRVPRDHRRGRQRRTQPREARQGRR